MLSLAMLLAAYQGPTIETLDELAKKKDYQSLAKFSTGDGHEFRVFRGGSYQVGSLGWSAKALKADGIGDFVVFTTPLTSEDIGELLFQRVGNKLQYIDESEKDGLRIRYQDLHVHFNIEAKTTSILDKVTVEITPNSKAFHLLRFSPCYQVSSITDGTNSVPFHQSGGIVMIPKQAAGTMNLWVTYKGTVNLPNYAGSIQPGLATLTNDYWYPMANRMPCRYRISVVPPGPDYTVVAQGDYKGKESGVKAPGEIFEMNLPSVYWSLTVLQTKHVQEKIDGRTLQMWSPRVDEERMKLQPALYAPILKLYNEKFSPFPFQSYGALDSPVYGGGALEAYSYATYGGGLPAEDAHEPSHTWWGGILPNTYLHSFWNESFADWSDGFYHREVPIGNNDERRKMFQTVSTPDAEYKEATLMNSGVASGTAGGALGYGKGALVLAMLEQLVGTENLLKCEQEWIRTHPVGEPAEWEEFEAVTLKTLPQFSLKSFFDDWFRRPGWASFVVENGRVEGNEVTLKFAWTGPRFRMPLDVWLEDSSGNRIVKTVDTKDITSANTIKISAPKFNPVRVYVDPYHRALRDGADPRVGSIDETLSGLHVNRDPKHPEYLTAMAQASQSKTLDGSFIIGHPDTMPEMKPLLARAGFVVKGNQLTYDGTTIDLTKGAALAVVEMGGGKRCVIGLGVTKMRPSLGMARVGLVDELGRALRGKVGFPLNATATVLTKS